MKSIKRLSILTIVGVALPLAGATTPAAAGSSPSRCASAGSKTVAVTTQARVYSKRGVIYGCAYRSGKALRLGRDVSRRCPALEGCQGLTRVAVSGRRVAYDSFASDRDGARTAIIVVDLLRRRPAVRWVSPEPTPQQPVRTKVSDLAVTGTGRLAWIATSTNRGGEPGTLSEVYLDRGTGETVVDSGPAIEAGSLAVASNLRVFWINAGQPKTATLR